MKKVIAILTISFISIMGFWGYKYYTSQAKLPDYLIENKDKKFKTEKEREEYIEQYGTKTELDNSSENSGNEEFSGGYEGINIIGLDSLSELIGLDNYIKCETLLQKEFGMLPQIIKETSNYNDEQINQYFSKNRNTLLKYYGLENTREFRNFLATKNYLKEETTINEVDVKNSIKAIGNTIHLQLDITTNSGLKKQQRIKIIKMLSIQDYLIVWE